MELARSASVERSDPTPAELEPFTGEYRSDPSCLPDGAVGRSIVGDLREEWARGRPGAGRDWSYTGAALLLAARYRAVGLVGTLDVHSRG